MSTDNNSKDNITENNRDEQKLENECDFQFNNINFNELAFEYLRKLEEYLNELKITKFDYSQFNFDDLKIIGHGGFAVVYSAELQAA
ncbi:6878_t:CDS:2 [Racocetra fulgida]|uniref:6878_t:CDS:1 n=1 Tax=Racocetra fulgida TaxID=60492 RepID=A0A9N9IL09_9GLOM|nr:6878_t:CDS:2 [Racocetra fulgida]